MNKLEKYYEIKENLKAVNKYFSAITIKKLGEAEEEKLNEISNYLDDICTDLGAIIEPLESTYLEESEI